MGQIAPDLTESSRDALLGTILTAVKLLLDGMSYQRSGRGKAFLLYCLSNLSTSFVRKADGGLRHDAPSLSKARRGAFSDMLEKKNSRDSQTTVTATEVTPVLSAGQSLRKPRGEARTNPIYVPLPRMTSRISSYSSCHLPISRRECVLHSASKCCTKANPKKLKLLAVLALCRQMEQVLLHNA
jgi:hypothetical protein